RKPAHRKGKVQLIDATKWFQPLRKNLGKKNCELSEEDIRRIVDIFLAFEETEESRILPNEAFGYWKITVERPLRLKVDLSAASRARFRQRLNGADAALAELVDRVADRLGPGPHLDFNAFLAAMDKEADRRETKISAKWLKLLQTVLAERNEAAQPVIKRVYGRGKVEANPLCGLFAVTHDGETRVVEYEPDPELRDTEQVPLLEEGGIEAFFRREVLPYVPDAWFDAEATKIGYEINFTRYFYKPQPLRSLEEIRAEILAVQKETEGLLEEILGVPREVAEKVG
ncbi:MAG: SAM-dependent DNA methyltransferase, partial [Firmicutes bacterium]|nr:SAM-dependent DNA methyltransferase [Bacillota bacterium]